MVHRVLTYLLNVESMHFVSTSALLIYIYAILVAQFSTKLMLLEQTEREKMRFPYSVLND